MKKVVVRVIVCHFLFSVSDNSILSPLCLETSKILHFCSNLIFLSSLPKCGNSLTLEISNIFNSSSQLNFHLSFWISSWILLLNLNWLCVQKNNDFFLQGAQQQFLDRNTIINIIIKNFGENVCFLNFKLLLMQSFTFRTLAKNKIERIPSGIFTNLM